MSAIRLLFFYPPIMSTSVPNFSFQVIFYELFIIFACFVFSLFLIYVGLSSYIYEHVSFSVNVNKNIQI